MDQKAADRIANTRPKDDGFAKRAQIAARNNEKKGSSSDTTWRQDVPSKKDDSGQKI